MCCVIYYNFRHTFVSHFSRVSSAYRVDWEHSLRWSGDSVRRSRNLQWVSSRLPFRPCPIWLTANINLSVIGSRRRNSSPTCKWDLYNYYFPTASIDWLTVIVPLECCIIMFINFCIARPKYCFILCTPAVWQLWLNEYVMLCYVTTDLVVKVENLRWENSIFSVGRWAPKFQCGHPAIRAESTRCWCERLFDAIFALFFLKLYLCFNSDQLFCTDVVIWSYIQPFPYRSACHSCAFVRTWRCRNAICQ